jgi:hypothetical protein
MRSLWSMLAEVKACPDCKIVPKVTSSGDKFNDVQMCKAHKEKRKTDDICEECKEPIALAGYSCQSCCEHEFDADEGYHCLNCALDGSEDVMAAAYDRAKDFRKYGDT